MTSPARITIELEAPPHARGRWRSRTRVDGQLAHHDGAPEFGARGFESQPFEARPFRDSQPFEAAQAPAIEVVEIVESREPAVVPAYEPAIYQAAECTCIEGWCGTDHANE